MQYADIRVLDGKIESTQFTDIYFSPGNGIAESQYNFIDANCLAERFQANTDFYLAETGFGTGLNFLLTLALWRNIKSAKTNHNAVENTGTLHYFSSEKYPIAPAVLTNLYQSHGEYQPLQEEAKALLSHYQPQNKAFDNVLVIDFTEWRCRLTILLGDNSQAYKNLTTSMSGKFDAWFLDGFAPTCNPEMWTSEFFQTLRQLSKFGTSISSFTVAAVVKKPLIDNGFTVTKRKGFGRKREMLYAELSHD